MRKLMGTLGSVNVATIVAIWVMLPSSPAFSATFSESYSSFYYSYYAADFHLDNCARTLPEDCDNGDGFIDRGDTGKYSKIFSLYLQYKGINELPNEAPAAGLSLTIDTRNMPDDFWYYGFSGSFPDAVIMDVTFDDDQNIIEWSGGAYEQSSGDGYFLDSTGSEKFGYTTYDSLRPQIATRFYTSRPGYWRMEWRTNDGCTEENIPCGSAFSSPPAPIVPSAPIPLPASWQMLIVGMMGLGLWFRKSRVRGVEF